MGYALLWVIALVGELVLLATLMACIGRLERRGLRTVLSVLVALASFSACLGLLCVIEMAKAERIVAHTWGRPIWFLTLFYAIGASWILFRGLRAGPQQPDLPRAATWPRGKLAVALFAAFVLYMMTFWNLDVAVRQRVAALRVDAGALAASVAPTGVPDRDNAALIYQQAYELMPPAEFWRQEGIDWIQTDSSDFDPEAPELREFLKTQAPALRLLRQGSRKPGCCFGHGYLRPGIDILLPGLVSIRTGARLVAPDARSKAAAGDVHTAMEDVNTLFVMAEHAATEPILVGVMVSAALEHMAVEALRDVLAAGQVSADELDLLEISDTVSYRRLFERALWMEEAIAIATYCDYGAELRLTELFESSTSSWQDTRLASLYRVFAMDDDLASYREALKQCRQRAGRPYHQAAEESKASEDGMEDRIRGLLAQILLPAVNRVAERAAETDARHRLARLAVAVARYRAAEDRFPDTLDDLVARFLPAIPLDPFNGKPLRIEQTDEAFILYSVGPDGTDDDGAPYEPEERAGDITFGLTR